jgi:hypothetical protein
MCLSLWLESLGKWQILGYSSQGASELSRSRRSRAIATTDKHLD